MIHRQWKRALSGLLVWCMLFSMLLGSAIPAMANGGTSIVLVKLSPTDDASVHRVNTGTNYATGTLILGAGRQFWMKFDLSSVTDEIQSATLKLYKTNTNQANFTVYHSVYDNWTDTTINWSNQPINPGDDAKIGSACATDPCVTSGGKYAPVSIELTDLVKAEHQGDQLLSLVFKRDNIDGSPGVDFGNKENADALLRPVLEIETIKEITADERVANDKAKLLATFDNIEVTTDLTLPVEGETNTAITWESSEPIVLSNTGKVTRPEYTQADVPVVLTARVAYGSIAETVSIHVLVKRLPTPSDAERVAKDKELLIAKYNNMTVYEDVYLPTVGSYGFSTITWLSAQPEIVSNMGAVNRPAADSSDANVQMTATLQYGDVSDTAAISFIVPKLTVRTEAKQNTLQGIIEEAELLKNQFIAGAGAGQVSSSAREQFEAEIQNAQNILADPNGDLDLGVQKLRDAGVAYVQSTVSSDLVVDVKENKLEFSSYRKQLISLVWEAKTMLFIEPEMYTEASKDAVRDQIQFAQSVLDGSYKVPFIRHREFYKPRPDEDIQFAIDHYAKSSHPFSEKYGLKEVMSWYRNNHILAGTYNTMKLNPTDDAFVQLNQKTTPHNGSTIIYGEGRTGYMKFDLSPVTADVMKADLFVTNYKNDRNNTQVHYEANDSWQEDTLLYPTVGDPVLGPIINTFVLGAKDVVGTGYVDLTAQVKAELLGDKVLSLGFTNLPGTRYASEIHSNNAPDPNKRPYLELSVNQVVYSKLQQKYDRIIDTANELVQNAVAGTDVWQYPQEKIDAVKAAVTAAGQALQGGNVVDTGAALVDVYDAMNEMRNAQKLRSEAEPNSTLYFNEDGLQELRDKINQNPDLKAKYEEAKQISDLESLEQLQAYRQFLEGKVDYDVLNEQYKLWSTSDNLLFTPPANTATISLRFTLESSDNEAEGLGHAWIDNIKISPENAGDLDIPNRSFESGGSEPEYWMPAAVKGSPVMKWENRTNHAIDGNRSIYIENPTANDQGAWTSIQDIPVNAGTRYTMTFATKIDGKLKNGVKATVSYKDRNGNVIGTTELSTNRKSTMGPPTNLSIQADALVYAVTGDITYAKKAKERIFFRLNDFLQGAEHWQINNSRPDNIDAYGKVQGGRVASIIASAYTFIKDANVYSDEEYEDLINKLNYFNAFLNDSRDRHELEDYTVQLGASNWETDAVIGAAMLSMVFPELANSKQLIANANKLIKAQFTYAVGAEGEWPESIRYHFAVLQRLAVYAKALRNQTGEDWFVHPKLVKMFEYNLEVQTPPYAYTNHTINSPIFGDDIMTGGNEFSLLGLYYDEIARTNVGLASRMYQTWVKAGSRLPANGLETILLESFFNPVDYIPPHSALDLKSTDKYKGVGLIMFRNHFGTPKETFMSIMANTTPLGHGHLDQGGFILYAGSTPLVLDPGIESYFDSTRGWYQGSSSHSTVQFKNPNNSTYSNTPAISTDHSFSTNSLIDTMSLNIADPNSGSTGSQKRTIAYVKNGIEAFIVWDQVNGPNNTIWNLPVASAQFSEIAGNKVTSTGHYHMDLETTILQPAAPVITQEWGRATNMVPAIDGQNQLEYIRVTNDAGKNYFAVLYPKAKSSAGLQTERIDIGNSEVDVYRLQTAGGRWVYVAANNGAADTTVALESEEDLVNLKTQTVYAITNGAAEVTLGAGELLVVSKVPSPLDTSALETKLAEAQAAVEAALIDDSEKPLYGRYTTVEAQKLKDAIAQAVAVLGSADSQDEIIQAVTELETAIDAFEASMNKNIGIGDVALAASNFDETNASNDWKNLAMYDFNANGVMDIYDLAALARAMLE
jgi:hypothetical protein